MLYLAEVLKESSFVKGKQTKIKLLACQRSEQSWSSVPGEEVIQAEEANKFNDGALILVDLTANKQVQRVLEAGRQLVSILQNFSRSQEKFKTQEEEIEQWKQSLTYQSQELNRREMEMESRREQLQQMEEDFEQLEQQRQEVEVTREEATRLREELDRNRQELEGAWDHLNGEKRRFEEMKEELQGRPSLDDEQARKMQELLNRLSGAIAPTDSVREQLNQGFELTNNQQSLLDQHWQKLEQQRTAAQQGQEEVDRQAQDLHNRWQEWHQAQAVLEQARSELKAQQSVLHLKQEYAQFASLQRQTQEELHQQVYGLAEGSDQVKVGLGVDTQALDKMSLEELQSLLQEMERDQEKTRRFVSDQEEELTSNQEIIEDLRKQIQQASDFDRLNLETELVEAQEGYQLLDDSLEKQRRILREREELLNQHKAVLLRRQGQADNSWQDTQIDLGPILAQIEAQRQQQTEELQKLEAQIEQMRSAMQQAQELVNQQSSQQEAQRNELKQLEQTLKHRYQEVAELGGRVQLYQEMLQPVQDHLNGTKQKLETISGSLAQFQETSDYQLQAIAEMRQVVISLVNVPEMAAS